MLQNPERSIFTPMLPWLMGERPVGDVVGFMISVVDWTTALLKYVSALSSPVVVSQSFINVVSDLMMDLLRAFKLALAAI